MADEAMTDDSDSTDTSGTEDAGKPTLDQLLESWDKNVEKAKPKDDGLAREVARLSYKLEMKDIIGKVRGDLPVNDEFVETYVNMRADKDSRLQKLWDQRDENRAEFDEAMKGLSKDFQKFAEQNGFTKQDEGDKGLSAAARIARESNSSGSDFDSVSWGSLSDSELALKKREVFRLAEAGKLK